MEGDKCSEIVLPMSGKRTGGSAAKAIKHPTLSNVLTASRSQTKTTVLDRLAGTTKTTGSPLRHEGENKTRTGVDINLLFYEKQLDFVYTCRSPI